MTRGVVAALHLFAWGVALSSVLGCVRDDTSTVIGIPSWVLSVPGHEPREVSLPGHLDGLLPAGATTYVLRTRVFVPEHLRDRPLTLTIRSFAAVPHLAVDGRPARSLLSDPAPARLLHAWAIEPVHADSAALELIVDHRSRRSAWIDGVPELTSEIGGTRSFRTIEVVNRAGVVGGVGAIGAVVLLYGALAMSDRRRKAPLMFLAQVGFGLLIALYATGWSYPILGDRDETFVRVTTQLAAVGGLEFTRAHFGLTRPSRAWTIAGLVCAAILATAPDGFRLARLAPIGAVGTLAIGLAQILALVNVMKARERRLEATTFAVGWAVLLVGAAIEFWRSTGHGEPFSGAQAGLRFMIPAIALFGLLQAALMGLAHGRSLRDADALNVQLAARMNDLMHQQSEIAILNDELRRKVVDRSRQLAEALAIARTDNAQLEVGDVIDGRYRIVGRLGQGGMGVVFQVARVGDERELALKMLLKPEGPEDLARLVREARVAADTDHPNIVRVVDVDVSSSGLLYVVSELVSGGSLESKRSEFGNIEWATPILADVANGMAALHARQITHRDLKPANVLLDRNGRAKIADFGIAAIHDVDALGETARAESADAIKLTKTGAWLGTPYYMAPELARGVRDAGEASDVWSFGVMAIEMLTAKPPFAVPPFMDALVGRPSAPPILDALTTPLREIVGRCLDLAPSHRPTFAELDVALRAVAGRG